ncbi:putative mfs multidrug [Phaeomoniella chlamydospora]|uniref:Putative mfs multidrug n=1 Tax=Phaeomoniella chlamydospora TaxID=158046 RepID=A0A0G2ECI9_PHACM|nr:putative mfs multidrug [Phaeomoniella chlamydospora]
MVPQILGERDAFAEEAREVTPGSKSVSASSAHDFASQPNKEFVIDDQLSSDDEAETSAEQGLLRPNLEPRSSAIQRRLSFVDEDEAAPIPVKPEKEKPVTWMSLPRKDQLAILTLARLAEPLTERGLQAYLFYQLKSFDANLSDATISSQAGMLSASFAAAQFCTAVLWGRAADSPRFGRKRVLMVGLTGTFISCLGMGFAKSFKQAVFFRVLGGAVNGNVGVMRTMISEIIKEKKFQSRAFLLLPMCFNIGVIIGPMMGGFLAEPVTSIPALFGPDSTFGGKDGVHWLKTFPYSLPNLFSALIILIAFISVLLGLDETHPILKYKTDWGRKIGRSIFKLCLRGDKPRYLRLDTTIDDSTAPSSIDLETQPHHANTSSSTTPARTQEPPHTISSRKPTFCQIFTPNVLLTLFLHFLLAIHISSFNALIFIFLPAPRSPTPPPQPQNLLHFTGGLGLPTSKVGLATAIIGFIGFPLQIFFYPRLHTLFGTLKCYRIFLPFSPLAYTLIPYLSLLPSTPLVIWPSLTLVLALQVISRTFALPGAIILVNNSCPSPQVLGTIHGVAQSVSSAARTIGPLVSGWALGVGLKDNIVGAVWWAMAGVALVGWGFSWAVFEGNGVDDEAEKDRGGGRRRPR